MPAREPKPTPPLIGIALRRLLLADFTCFRIVIHYVVTTVIRPEMIRHRSVGVFSGYIIESRVAR